MKRVQKIAALLLCLMLTLTALPALAEDGGPAKEEVVYISLHADGTVKEIYVVNLFDLAQDATIVDYGEYTSVRSMTTADPIDYTDGAVTIRARAGKLYYEGRLSDTAMPWDISIHYFLDGEERAAQELAGKSGRLEIRMSVRQNPDCDGTFFAGYALQASVTLNTDLAANISAEGATVANVGRNKQLTYTILPNTERDVTISADVHDFEMEAIAINGIRMNLDVAVDDAVLTGALEGMVGAVSQLNEGAAALNTGAGGLSAAAKQLSAAANDLNDGAASLKAGLDTLTARNGELTDAAWAVYEGLCAAAEAQLNAQLTENGLAPVVLTPDTCSEVLSGLLAQLDASAVYDRACQTALTEVTAQTEAQADMLYAGYMQSQADAICTAYVQSQADALYAQAACRAAAAQLMAGGMTQAQAEAYLQTPEGQALAVNAVAAMTDAQKEQVIAAALTSLTEEQRAQILQGALTALTDAQKAEIRAGMIQRLMASEAVTAQIDAAVAQASAAAAQVAALKAQLDSFSAFYSGLTAYTGGVATAADGADQLAGGLSTLSDSTGALSTAAGEMHTAAGTLQAGTQAIADKAAGMGTEIGGAIDAMIAAMTGSEVETKSFVSARNTRVEAVQFVIRTEAISIPPVEAEITEEAPLSFWEKLLKLFGR